MGGCWCAALYSIALYARCKHQRQGGYQTHQPTGARKPVASWKPTSYQRVGWSVALHIAARVGAKRLSCDAGGPGCSAVLPTGTLSTPTQRPGRHNRLPRRHCELTSARHSTKARGSRSYAKRSVHLAAVLAAWDRYVGLRASWA